MATKNVKVGKPSEIYNVYHVWYALTLYVKNESEKKIAFLVSETYPDTTLPESPYIVGVPVDTKEGQKVVEMYERKWSRYFDDLPKDTLSFFIFSSDTLAQYSWTQMRAEYKVLKRFDLSKQDVERTNGIVVYEE